MSKIAPVILLIFCFPGYSDMKGQTISDSVFVESVRTVQVYREGWELSYPIIELGSGDQLVLSFDELADHAGNYYYTIVHCNSDWEVSQAMFHEYAEGFSDNRIMNFSFSTNTIVDYVHYKVVFPSEECKIKISGNFFIKVFNEMDENHPILTRRFYVYEDLASINLNVKRSSIPYLMDKGHETDMKITINIDDLTDPYHQIKTVVCQNFDFANAHTNLFPVYINDKQLIYNDPDVNYFKALNEFRSFDMKDIKTAPYRVEKIENIGTYYQVQLEKDESRARKQFMSVEDINGKYFIENKRGFNKDIDADYMMVRFRLAWPGAPIDGGVYVYGGLTDWQCSKKNQMTYDPGQHLYSLDLLLKQGTYNYMYAWKEKPNSPPDASMFEGSHYETENDYEVFVYYQFPQERFERLIGATSANSQIK